LNGIGNRNYSFTPVFRILQSFILLIVMAYGNQFVLNISPFQTPDFPATQSAKRPQENGKTGPWILYRCGDESGNFGGGKDTFLLVFLKSLFDILEGVPIKFLPVNGIPHRNPHPLQDYIDNPPGKFVISGPGYPIPNNACGKAPEGDVPETGERFQMAAYIRMIHGHIIHRQGLFLDKGALPNIGGIRCPEFGDIPDKGFVRGVDEFHRWKH
jgi:hypothetical protein